MITSHHNFTFQYRLDVNLIYYFTNPFLEKNENYSKHKSKSDSSDDIGKYYCNDWSFAGSD